MDVEEGHDQHGAVCGGELVRVFYVAW
jgi:hypothetical protein